MKYSSALFSALFLVLMVRCTSNQRSENPENWTEDQVSEWFDQKDWLGPTELQPDPSIDAKEVLPEQRSLGSSFYLFKLTISDPSRKLNRVIVTVSGIYESQGEHFITLPDTKKAALLS